MIWLLLVLLGLLLLAVGLYQRLRPLPPGLSQRGEAEPVQEIRFLADRTWVEPSPDGSDDASDDGSTDGSGPRQVEQEIFDEVLAMIDRAESLIVLDMFLFNDVQGETPETTRAISSELVQALLRAAERDPGPRILVITDPINDVYGSVPAPGLRALEEAGIPVIRTDLRRLPDSHPLYSTPWRLLVAPFGGSAEGGWLPNPFTADGRPRVSLRALLELLNFKANHRKVLVVDDAGDGLAALVTSANPHDGSSAHGNVALRVKGPVAADLLASELAVADFSARDEAADDARRAIRALAPELAAASGPGDGPEVALATEGAILEAILESLEEAGPGDRVELVMFYLSERRIVDALVAAAERGAELRLILDPNKDAFGRQKNGVPNRPVARELVDRGVPEPRWCDTHGEQCHAKMLLLRSAGGNARLILGSANFTRRNLRDLNLETNLVVDARESDAVIRDAAAYVEELWSNAGGRVYSTTYPAYEDASLWKALLYRVMESAGIGTF